MADKAAAKSTVKTAKGNSQIFDVSRPGKQAANATSRPVIVTNRPMMQDPMMLSSATMAEAADNPGTSPSAPKIKIQPLSADEKKTDAAPKKIDKAPKTSALASAPALPTTISLVDEADNQTTVAVRTTPTSDTPVLDTTTDEAPKDETTKPPEPTPESASETDPIDTEPETETDDSPVSSDELPAEDDEPASDPAPVTSTSSNSFMSDDSPVTSNEAGVNEKAAAELEAEAKKREALDELVDTKAFYLPINSVEKRRSIIMSILGVVLIIALGLFLVNMLMDVGTINIKGIKPLTNFFGN